MKLSVTNFKKSSGFTLIELLVVIAIIGILAAALIATLDPLEQIRKANDTTKKNTAAEAVSAVTRYFGSHQNFPWGGAVPVCADPLGGTTLDGWDCVPALITDGELKPSFADSSLPVRQAITVINNGTSILGCFVPESKSGQADPSAQYNADGTPGCAVGVGSGCSWCAQ